LLVERLADRDLAQRDNALKMLRNEIAGATRTLTSVPKPLKFLSPHYQTIVKLFDEQTDVQLKVSTFLLALTKNSNYFNRLATQIWLVS
jgi:26S proteasome regulatory subunit N1